jgi:hypothetical protein
MPLFPSVLGSMATTSHDWQYVTHSHVIVPRLKHWFTKLLLRKKVLVQLRHIIMPPAPNGVEDIMVSDGFSRFNDTCTITQQIMGYPWDVVRYWKVGHHIKIQDVCHTFCRYWKVGHHVKFQDGHRTFCQNNTCAITKKICIGMTSNLVCAFAPKFFPNYGHKHNITQSVMGATLTLRASQQSPLYGIGCHNPSGLPITFHHSKASLKHIYFFECYGNITVVKRPWIEIFSLICGAI